MEKRLTMVALKRDDNQPPNGCKAFWGVLWTLLCLAFSSDGGLIWLEHLDLGESDGFCFTNNSKNSMNREYSYPSIIQGIDGRIHEIYTYFRQRIKYLSFDPARIGIK